MREVLSVDQMYQADRAALAAGISGPALMEAAGAAVARAVMDRWTPRPVAVLCGPGNNGGDGFVAARHLSQAGWPVRLGLLGAHETLRGDAAWAAGTWQGRAEVLDTDIVDGARLVIDALFGAGLSRPLEGRGLAVLQRVQELGIPIVAVDVPSGVRGDDGGVLGIAVPAALTVTFFRPKPGHLLLPGRSLCGDLKVVDIGIPETVFQEIRPSCWQNSSILWRGCYPWPRADSHKYARGHVVVLGGPVMTGAGRLAARGALRVGAGLVTVAAPGSAVQTYALSMPSAIVLPCDEAQAFAGVIADPRHNTVLLGPGSGADEKLRRCVRAAVEAGKAGVLDADVFTAFAGDEPALVAGLSDRWLLTPHEGEFQRLFGRLPGSKLDRARTAAARCGAVVLLKGADTVIAHPDGRAVINTNAPPELATAGSGDVLAGFAAGLIAQGMDAFDAGCAAAWLHGEVGTAIGPGLMAEDLPDALPPVLRALRLQCI